MIYSHSYIKGLGGFENVQRKVGYGWFIQFNTWEESKAIYQIWVGTGNTLLHSYSVNDLFQKSKGKNKA